MLKESRKTMYTQRVLRDALMELMREKPAERVTVTELCRQADVNRNTFYLHYTDIYDLLDKTAAEVSASIERSFEEDGALDSCEAYLTRLLTVAKENRGFIEVLIADNYRSDMLSKAFEPSNARLLSMWKDWAPELSDTQLEYTMLYTSGGIVSAVREWFRRGLMESPEELATTLAALSPRRAFFS